MTICPSRSSISTGGTHVAIAAPPPALPIRLGPKPKLSNRRSMSSMKRRMKVNGLAAGIPAWRMAEVIVAPGHPALLAVALARLCTGSFRAAPARAPCPRGRRVAIQQIGRRAPNTSPDPADHGRTSLIEIQQNGELFRGSAPLEPRTRKRPRLEVEVSLRGMRLTVGSADDQPCAPLVLAGLLPDALTSPGHGLSAVEEALTTPAQRPAP